MSEDEPLIRCDDDYADWWEQRSLRLLREVEAEPEEHERLFVPPAQASEPAVVSESEYHVLALAIRSGADTGLDMHVEGRNLRIEADDGMKR